MADSRPSPALSWNPATFAERGVAAPFTAPQLLGARLRDDGRGSADLTVPNPSGGRGVYVLDWHSGRELFRPTLHDTVLHQQVGRAGAVTPATVRTAARRVATDGLAGRAARHTALQAARDAEEDRIRAHFLLMMCLVDQAEPGGIAISETMPRTDALIRRARAVIGRVGPMATPTATVADALEGLAAPYAALGVHPDSRSPRLPRLIARMRTLCETLAAQPSPSWHDRHPALAAGIAAAAARFADETDRLLRDCRRLTGDMTALLRLWASRPDAVTDVLARPEWLLDGWEQICAIWELAATPLERRAALVDIGTIIPPLPHEAAAWQTDTAPAGWIAPHPPLAPSGGGTPRGSVAFALVARNERLRAVRI